MKSVCLITLGTRDIQFSRNILTAGSPLIVDSLPNDVYRLQIESEDTQIQLFSDPHLPGFLLPLSPRQASAGIAEHREMLKPWLVFPILKKVLDYFLPDNFPSEFWLVYTDQARDELNLRHWSRDTVGYAELASEYIREFCLHKGFPLPVFFRIPYSERITDLEFVYSYTGQFLFGEKNFDSQTLLDPDTRLYLINQGGIDAINTALLLKLTEYRPDLVLLQVRDDDTPCRTSSFPARVFQNYQKRILVEAAEQFRFDWIQHSGIDPCVRFVARTAIRVINYDWAYFKSRFIQDSQLLANQPGGSTFISGVQEMVSASGIPAIHIVAIEWYYRQELYSEVLWRLFTFSESLFRLALEGIGSSFPAFQNHLTDAEIIRILWLNDREFGEDYTRAFRDKLSGKDSKYVSSEQIHFVLNYYSAKNHPQKKQINQALKVNLLLTEIKTSRNRLIHQGTGSNDYSLDKKLKKTEIQSLNKLIGRLRKDFQIRDMGVLNIFRDFILNRVRLELFDPQTKP